MSKLIYHYCDQLFETPFAYLLNRNNLNTYALKRSNTFLELIYNGSDTPRFLDTLVEERERERERERLEHIYNQ